MTQEELTRSGNSATRSECDDCMRPGWDEDDRCRVCNEFTCKSCRVYLGEGFVCWDCDTPDRFTCPDCGRKGCSEEFSTCSKCEQFACDACIQRMHRRKLCPGCHAKRELKCGECLALKADRNWGAIHVDCEECDRPVCKACISLVFTGSRKKQLCPKCAKWKRTNPV